MRRCGPDFAWGLIGSVVPSTCPAQRIRKQFAINSQNNSKFECEPRSTNKQITQTHRLQQLPTQNAQRIRKEFAAHLVVC